MRKGNFAINLKSSLNFHFIKVRKFNLNMNLLYIIFLFTSIKKDNFRKIACERFNGLDNCKEKVFFYWLDYQSISIVSFLFAIIIEGDKIVVSLYETRSVFHE